VNLRRWWPALAGIVAAAAALAVAEVVAVATGPRTAPMVAVGGVVVDAVPEPIKQLAIDVFGVHDKTALLVGTGILLALFAAAIGMAARRRLRYGLAGAVLFGAVGAAAALTRPGAGAAAMLPSLAGAAAAALVLWLLLTGASGTPATARDADAAAGTGTDADTSPAGTADGTAAGRADGTAAGVLAADGWDEPGAGRRRLLAAGALIGGSVVVGGFGRLLSSRRDVTAVRESLTLPVPVSPARPVPAGADLGLDDLAPYMTPNNQFYRIDTALVVPRVDPRTWQLKISGRVRTPLTFSYDDIVRRPMVERHITLACVSNEVGGDLIGNARWLGVPVKGLLDEAGPLPGADQVVGRSSDGWTCGTPTEVLRDGRDALLAIGMNGEPLPIEHGFPARIVVPGLYGYVSACKWVVELELSSFDDFDAYWVPRGWAAKGPIKTQSRIDRPRAGASVPAGAVTVAGVAWAQHRGVAAVEVRVDDGPWQAATLAEAVSADTWRQWSYRWVATGGEHRLAVRATDTTGEVQTERRQPVAPDGATGWHTIDVTVA
jgi:DMSO/TMAO reductase YedYZ molybdopterin-dependent catalytic subunit